MLNFSFSFWLIAFINSIISMMSPFLPTQRLNALLTTPAFQNAVVMITLLSAAYVSYHILPYVRRAFRVAVLTIGSLALLSLGRATYLVLPRWTSEAKYCILALLKRFDTIVLDFAEQGVALVQPSLVSSASGDPAIQHEAAGTFLWIVVFGVIAMALACVIRATNRTLGVIL